MPRNLATATALLWVVLRPTGHEPPYEIVAVTAEPSEGEAFTKNETNIVEAVPMPEPVCAVIADLLPSTTRNIGLSNESATAPTPK